MARKRNHRNTAFIVLFVCVLFGILIVSDPFHTHLDERNVKPYSAKEITEVPMSDTFKVMTWNIKFGGARIDFFFDCYGDRVIMTHDEVIENLKGLLSKINQYQPDILFLQEVDVHAKRSANIDQMQWLLDHTEMNYGVYAPQWKSSYIPSNGIGNMNSGNAILSRWQLHNPQRISLPLFEEQNFIVRYFYLRRNILTADLLVDGDSLLLVNTHLAAYSKDGTKKKQLDILYNLLHKTDSTGHTFLMGGDLNSLPPGSNKVKDFADAACEDENLMADDYSEETEWMVPLYQFHAAIPLDTFQQDNAPYFTHTTRSPTNGGFWSRKIDFMFTNAEFIQGSGLTHQNKKSGGVNTMELSDHAPISVEFFR